MITPLSVLGSDRKYKVDFALVPVAIVLIEFAVLATQLSSQTYQSITNLLLLRLIHTFLMVIISLFVSQIYIWNKKYELNYLTLSVTGILVIALGDLIHIHLSTAFGVELIDSRRRIEIILFEGSVWFPSFLIIAGNRKEIFTRFKEYEKRLIIAARSRSRTSPDFKVVQEKLQSGIKEDLSTLCASLKATLINTLQSEGSLQEVNQLLAPALLGHDLRRMSVELDAATLVSSPQPYLRKQLNSFLIFFQQFRILYTSAIRKSPLPQSTFVVILLGLVTPLYMYFYTFTEALTELPILILVLLVMTTLTKRAHVKGSSRSINIASMLIFATGLLPLLLDLFGEPFESKNGNHIPLLISSFALPLTYFVSMELFQVLRPTALALLEGDDLEASTALQSRVFKTLEDEFASNLSHQWAVFIHGKILTRLAATSLKLETASSQGDVKTFNESINSLLVILGSPDDDFEVESTSLEREVKSRLDPWRGLLNINLAIDPELLNLKNSRIRELGEVIEELLSNSIRHGKAKNIDLKVIRDGERDVLIISTDDAIIAPPQAQDRFGLGTRIFNLASDGRWSITRFGDTTEFRLTMGI